MGYFQVQINNQITKLSPLLKLDRYKTHNIEIVIDKLSINKESIKIIVRGRIRLRDKPNHGGANLHLSLETACFQPIQQTPAEDVGV